jgi:cell division septum initiation protein DivIVA
MSWQRSFIMAAIAGSVLWGESRVRADDESHLVRGKIVAVRPAERELIVQPRKGEPVKLTVNERSQLHLREGTVKLDQLREGMRVRVHYETKGGVNRVVSLQDALTTLNQVQRAVGGALDTARSYAFQQRDEYRRRLQVTMRDLDARIAELQERADEAGASARQRYEQELAKLRPKREALREKLAQVSSATAATWRDIQAGVGAAIDDVERTIERVRSNVAEPPPPR